MKGRLCVVAAAVVLFGAATLSQQTMAAEFNPQPEPPGKSKIKGATNPGDVKSGIQSDTKSTRKGVKPGETKTGIAIEDRSSGAAR